MQPQIILQALLLVVGTASPVPQDTSDYGLSKPRDFFGRGLGWHPTVPTTTTSTVVPPTSTPSLRPIVNTANDVTKKMPCKDNILLYARGPTEFGNIGSSVGPILLREIERLAAGEFLFQGIDYPVNILYNWGSGFDNGQAAGRHFRESVALCPNATIFLSGYSEGARAIHLAVTRLTAENKAQIGGIVTFGDPLQNQPFDGIDASKLKPFCALGDLVCETGSKIITASHLQYGGNGDGVKGAQFIAGLAT